MKKSSARYSAANLDAGAPLGRRAFLRSGLRAGALAVAATLPAACSRASSDSPNIILITLDTTRADHLSCYGYRWLTTPYLDGLAKESLVFSNVISPSSWTLPAHASLFTGKLVSSHGARNDPEGPLILADAIRGASRKYRARGLDSRQSTLASLLAAEGYDTCGVVAGPWMKRVFGLDKGFELYSDSEITQVRGRPAPSVTRTALDWLSTKRRAPFFLFLNYFDAHTPYTRRPGFERFLTKGKSVHSKTEQNLALYDAEINYVDESIGVLLQELKRSNRYDNTWIIVTADHGDLFGEHGMNGHGKGLFQEELHVPLIAKLPSGEGEARRIDTRIQLTDVLPWVLQRVGIPAPSDIQGQPPAEVSHPVIAEVYPLPFVSGYRGEFVSIFEGDYKYILRTEAGSPHPELYNLRTDPHEQINLTPKQPNRVKAMGRSLFDYLASLPKPGPAPPTQTIDPRTREALESVGYL